MDDECTLTKANGANSGTVDSFISASHVTKTRRAHQLTAASLHCLILHAYIKHCLLTEEKGTPTFEEWSKQQTERSAHFDYRFKVLLLEIMLLLYVRSLREGHFDLYVQSLAHITPWTFPLDHTHYSRWLSVHIRDMVILSKSIQTSFQNSVLENLLSTKQVISFQQWPSTYATSRITVCSMDQEGQLG